jgi:hypothetical protein
LSIQFEHDDVPSVTLAFAILSVAAALPGDLVFPEDFVALPCTPKANCHPPTSKFEFIAPVSLATNSVE